MSKVSQFRKKCIAKDFKYMDEFLRDDSLGLLEYSKANIFQKLSGIFKRDKRSNIQIAASQIKWYFKKLHNYDIIDHIFANNVDYSIEDLQLIFDSFIDACKSTKLHIPNSLGQEYIMKFMPIMNSENFEKAYSYLRDNAFDFIEQYENEKITDSERQCINNMYIYPICNIIEKIQEKQQKGEDNFSLNIYDIVGDDRYRFAKYLSGYCEMQLKNLFGDTIIRNNPKQVHDTYRFLLDTNTVYNASKTNSSNHNNLMMYSTFSYFKNDVFPNLSWSRDDYKNFFFLCSNGEKINTEDFPMVFSLINLFIKSQEQNPETKEFIKSFIERHRREYVTWLMYNCDENDTLSDLYFKKGNGKYTDNDIDVCEMIIEELIKRQNKDNIDLYDIDFIGKGGTSAVYKVGDYVVKIGTERFRNKIANHRRILQPIIRLKNEKAFIEVTDRVECGYFSEEQVKNIYYELLADGYIWNDAKWENLGVLKRKNVPRHGIKRVIKTEDGVKIIDDESSSDEKATNMIGNTNGKPLQEGEIVILDTDYVTELNDPWILNNIISREGKDMNPEIKKKLCERLKELKRKTKEEDKSDIDR